MKKKMRRLLKLGNWELWLATGSARPEMRPYEIALGETTVRLRRRILRRITFKLREIFRSVRNEQTP